jgi:excisionase family DNA binding protein
MQKLIISSAEELQELISSTIKEVMNPPVSKPIQPRYLGIKEAAKFLNLSVQTIYRFTSKGKIPFLKKGKKLLFLESELNDWLNSNS